jgi:FKBP-type peptidyl-prolyl cis-trans isomerase 2
MTVLTKPEKQGPKRLSPSDSTVKRLFALSGNLCAFPRCTERMVDTNGTIYGEICHIEAAMPNGERFNDTQTNEERASFDNLILFCSKHHITTNDVEKYTVELLKRIKIDHECEYLNNPYPVTDITVKKAIELYKSGNLNVFRDNQIYTGTVNQTFIINIHQKPTSTELKELIRSYSEKNAPMFSTTAEEDTINSRDIPSTVIPAQLSTESQNVLQTSTPVSKDSIIPSIYYDDHIFPSMNMIIGKIVKAGDTVSVDYMGWFEDETIFDTSDSIIAKKANIHSSDMKYAPISFVVGAGTVIVGFDTAVIGMYIGDIKTISLMPDQAYGVYNPSLIQPVPLKVLKAANITPEVNQTLYYNLQPVKIDKIIPNATDPTNTLVYVDFNSPMAGKILHFRIALRNIQTTETS